MSPPVTPTGPERRLLCSEERTLARIATVDAGGEPHVVPAGWGWDEEAGEFVLGGRDVARTARAAHVRDTGRLALTVDGVHDGPGWSPWALLARGPAYVDERAGTIRMRPEWMRSWGLPDCGTSGG